MKQIVFVCQVFYPDNTATSQLFGDLLANLVDSTTSITVLSGYPTRRASLARVPAQETWRGINIVRCGFDIDAKRSYWARLLAYLSFVVAMSFHLVLIRNKNMVFGVTNPPFLAIVLWLLSCLTRFRYQYMFLDLYPEGLVAIDKLRRSSWIAQAWRACNRLSFRRADKLIVLGRDMGALLAQNYGLPQGKFLYLPHWSSTTIQQPLDFAANSIATEYSLHGKFVVQYSGNMGLWHDINTIVLAASRLLARPDIHFLMVGDGIRRKDAEELAQKLQLTNISWLNFYPKERLPESLTCCHAALVSLRHGLEGVAVPSKLYGILASGRAVVAQVPALSEIAMVVEEEQCGIVVTPADINALVQAIVTIADDPVLALQMGKRAFAAYQNKYTLEQAVTHFQSLWADEPQLQVTASQASVSSAS
jgi:glycosyltransferase involved in cell wall biosynthesis